MPYLYRSKAHQATLTGDKGDDLFEFDIPAPEVYLGTFLYLSSSNLNSGCSIKEQPQYGATGRQAVRVKWWFDKPNPFTAGRVDYILTIKVAVPGKIMVYEDRDFEGRSYRFNEPVNQLHSLYMNDRISSFAILSGNWTFYKDDNFQNPYMKNASPIVVPPGVYSWTENIGIQSDQISSFQAVSSTPNA